MAQDDDNSNAKLDGSERARISDIVFDELGGNETHWDLAEHLHACIVASQKDPTFARAVYFAFEVLWGIAHDIELKAIRNQLDPKHVNAEWLLDPREALPVEWIWIRTLATAWGQVREGVSLGKAFGLEGGQGERPTFEKMAHELDGIAIARWIGAYVRRHGGSRGVVENAIQAAAAKFDKSDVTIKRAWQQFGKEERRRIQRWRITTSVK